MIYFVGVLGREPSETARSTNSPHEFIAMAAASERRNKDALPEFLQRRSTSGIVARGNVTDVAFRHGDVDGTGPSLDHANTAKCDKRCSTSLPSGICQLTHIKAATAASTFATISSRYRGKSGSDTDIVKLSQNPSRTSLGICYRASG